MRTIFDSWLWLPHPGEFLSLLSALIWAFAVILFRIAGKKVSAVSLNLFKIIFALALLSLTMLGLGLPFFPPLSGSHYALLFLSGVVGIAISDTLLFVALNRLGAELTAIVDCAYAPFVIGFSFLFLGERMNPLQTLGAALIILAMVLILQKKTDVQIPRRALLSGVGAGILSMFFSAAGVVMMKPMLAEASPVWAGFVRTLGAAAALGLFVAFHPRRRVIMAPLRSLRNMRILIPASFLGSYLSVVVWIGGMKFAQASIAAALNQMSTIFIFMLAAIFLKEKITPIKLAAVVIAFAGAILVSVPF